MVTDWSLLGSNPAPGDPVRVQVDARIIAKTGLTAEACATGIEGISGGALGIHASTLWQGEAAETFAERLRELPQKLRQVEAAHRNASNALKRYASNVDQLQHDARSALDRAMQARSERSRAARQHDEWVQAVSTLRAQASTLETEVRGLRARVLSLPPDDPQCAVITGQIRVAQSRLNTVVAQRDSADRSARTAAASVDEAQARLSGSQRIAEQIRQVHSYDAHHVAREINEAASVDITHRGFFQQLWHDIVEGVDDLDGVLGKVGNILALVTAGAFLVVLVLGTGGMFLAAISAVALMVSKARLVTTMFLVANGRRTWKDGVFAVVDVVGSKAAVDKAKVILKANPAGLLTYPRVQGGFLTTVRNPWKHIDAVVDRTPVAQLDKWAGRAALADKVLNAEGDLENRGPFVTGMRVLGGDQGDVIKIPGVGDVYVEEVDSGSNSVKIGERALDSGFELLKP